MLKSLEGLDKVLDVGVMTNEDRPLLENGEVDWKEFDKIREDYPVCIDHKADMVSFKLMTKPVKEGGKGCQHIDMIKTAKHILDYFTNEEANKLEALTASLKKEVLKPEKEKELKEKYSNTLTSYNCNKATCIALAAALHQQMIRTADRESREVEGTYEA